MSESPTPTITNIQDVYHTIEYLIYPTVYRYIKCYFFHTQSSFYLLIGKLVISNIYDTISLGQFSIRLQSIYL